MRGRVDTQSSLFAYVDLESKVPSTHPLRRIRNICDTALHRMDSDLTAVYESSGRPSVPPEQLLKGCILQIMYGLRSERQLCEQIEFNMLYRWFLGMGLDEMAWDHSVYTRNRDRLLTSEIARQFLNQVVSQARKRGFVSKDHFSVDGTLIQAWASTKSLQPIEDKPEDPTDSGSSSGTSGSTPVGRDEMKDFRGQTFGNQTHRSVTDPDARLARKGDKVGAKMSYLANALMENRSGLVVDGEVRLASGDGGETAAAESMLYRQGGSRTITLGADKGYDTKDFIDSLDRMNVVGHVAQNKSGRQSAVADELAETSEYATSIKVRKRIEEIFGWVKQTAGLRQVKVRGKKAVEALTLFAFAAYNLVRINTLMTPVKAA
jgi:transposase